MRLLWIVILPSVAALAGCGSSASKPKSSVTKPAVSVLTAEVCLQQWPDLYEATGTVRAQTTAVLSSKVMAYVHEVAVQVGIGFRKAKT